VAVGPAGLDGVASHGLPGGEVEAAVVVGHGGEGDLAEHIGLSSAGGAGAVAAEEFEGKVGFAAVVPRDGEFGGDFLDGSGLEWRCHFILAGGFGDVRGLEVDGLGGACLSGPEGDVDCLRGGAVRVLKERGGGENRDARHEPRLGFIGHEECGGRREAVVKDVCVEPLVRTGVTEDMVFLGFVAEEGADALERR
jgi:hypothetical protein